MLKTDISKRFISLLIMFIFSFAVILLSEQSGRIESGSGQIETEGEPEQSANQTEIAGEPGQSQTETEGKLEQSANQTETTGGSSQSQTETEGEPKQIAADDSVENGEDLSRIVWKTRAANDVERNFGKYYNFVDSDKSYETYLLDRYKKHRISDLSKWKDQNGNWCYPKKYEFGSYIQSEWDMASRQFPPELLADMDTEELLAFILKGEKTCVSWGMLVHDNYLSWLVGQYRHFNFIHELMNRKDCAEAVHQYYKQYSEQDKKKYSKVYRVSGESKAAANFQFLEGLEWFYMAMQGMRVPDEYTYGSELESTLEEPSRQAQYTYQEDVTHDGVEDTITLHMAALYDADQATGEEDTVTVTSGKTGKQIASYTADTVHHGWNGIYLYENAYGKYLLQWQPMMYQGVGTFQLQVFCLDENGKKGEVLIKKEFHFELNPGRIDFDKKAYQDYIDLVNAYLTNSYVIIDTDQGEVMYGSSPGALMAPYDGSWIIDLYQECKSQEQK